MSSLSNRSNPDICIGNSHRIHGHEKHGDRGGRQSRQAGARQPTRHAVVRAERAARPERPGAIEGTRRGAEARSKATSIWRGEAGRRGELRRRRGAGADWRREARRRGEAGRRARAHRHARVGASRRGAETATRAKKTRSRQTVSLASIPSGWQNITELVRAEIAEFEINRAHLPAKTQEPEPETSSHTKELISANEHCSIS